ncbi:MAG: aldehyde-activating protein [Rhodospirillaceae bacterium]|nr:aldehyde-activating protein [Rhodospirillaceae bacterium]
MAETAREPVMTGGCQCGAVRYALYAEPFNPHICHCRMCQKAFGSFFAPLASVKNADFAWTAGAPGLFMSSTIAERGFCPACGTPLSFRYVDTDRIGVALGSLDDPSRVVPTVQYGIESRLPYFTDLAGLPGKTTEEDMAADVQAKLKSHQQGR